MATSAAIPKKNRSVRAPFRVLAGVIFLVGCVAVFGTAYMAWQRGSPLVPASFILWLPGMAWLVRFAFHAAVHGNAPDHEHWPFASSRVANWYWLIILVYSGSNAH